MGRRRFIQMTEPPYELVEVSDDFVAPSRHTADGTLWNDRGYEGMRASDGADISSRSKHREYMKSRGLTTMDDYKGEWAKAQKRRDQYRAEGKHGAVTKHDIAKAIHQLEK